MMTKQPDRASVTDIVRTWKFQRHVYEMFGRGRLLGRGSLRPLWESNIEAYDVMRKWCQAQEKQGAFRITDAELRRALHQKWEGQPAEAFLTEEKNKERIRNEFLEPRWAAKRPSR